MRLSSLTRPNWIAIALLVGLAHGSVREWSRAAVDPLDDYEVLITDQRQFEHALVTQSHGQPLFRDVVVYPHWVRDGRGGRRLLHLVTGGYWDGRPRNVNGALQARWEPACFVAATPYLVQDAAGQVRELPTVLDYLAQLRAKQGVRYRYAWWWWLKRPMAVSTVASLVLVGGVWPTVLNILLFGSMYRPPTERPASLWRARRSRAARKHEPSTAIVSAEATPPATIGPAKEKEAEPFVPAPILGPADDAPVPAGEAPHKEFAARKEDFYPTELHADADHHDRT